MRKIKQLSNARTDQSKLHRHLMRRLSTVAFTMTSLQVSLWRLERESKELKTHIHHSMGGHDGKSYVHSNGVSFLWTDILQKQEFYNSTVICGIDARRIEKELYSTAMNTRRSVSGDLTNRSLQGGRLLINGKKANTTMLC